MAEESRRKRKWDQPDESLIAAGIALPGILPITNVGTLSFNPLTANAIQAPILQQQAAAVIRKLTQPKPQDDLLIAREIVINDAESAVRYKLTRRQTQEEIQKCTGAVVITRGKYRPPNAMPDGEKPLYLHISAGAHMKETAEKIIAVDRASAMVEEMMKPMPKAFHASIYLGFDADPSLSIPTRIRGPNDQYISHIMNETGVTVLLRGRGCGIAGSDNLEGEQPLHLFLSSNNPKALEDARLLAENLLDTISRECGIPRVAPGKVYAAVPPPQYAAVPPPHNLLIEANSSVSSVAPLGSVIRNCSATAAVSSAVISGVSTASSYGAATQPGVSSLSGQSQPNGVCYSQPLLGNGTCYSGYGGIYPQATPLQQVALALRQTCAASSTNSPAMSTVSTAMSTSGCTSPVNNKRLPQKRKFQELPATSKGTVVSPQVPEDPRKSLSCKSGKVTVMPPPKKLAGMPMPPPGSMPPPPPKAMPPPPPKFSSTPSRSMPPPPPKFNSTASVHKVGTSSTDDSSRKSKPEVVPDTLVKLMEYGDDDDDDDPDETAQDSGTVKVSTNPKPFWAI